MNFLGLFRKKVQEEKRSQTTFGEALNYAGTPVALSESKSMLLGAVYRCVDLISDAVAQLPLESYRMEGESKQKAVGHSTYYVLNNEPNDYMSRYTFIKLLVTSMLLRGNAFAHIQRDKRGNVYALNYIDAGKVTIVTNGNNDRIIKYVVAGYKHANIEPCNMLHVMNFSFDGLRGVSTLHSARQCLTMAYNAEQTASGFFTGGCNVGGVLKVQSMLNQEQKSALKSSWLQAFAPDTGRPNGVAVLEGNMDFQPITLNPSDAQLLESRQYNVIDICRFFGVSPTKVFDLTKSSYASAEAENLAFLSDTLAPILAKLEQEFERKLLLDSEKTKMLIRFDTSVLLRTDKTNLAQYYSTLFNIGAISINEIRKGLDLPAIEGGDKHFVQVNMQSTNEGNQTTAPTGNGTGA